MITRSITLDCTYKIKSKQLEFNKACDELKQHIINKLDSEQFNSTMYAITKEVEINIDRKEASEVEFIITMFITTINAPESLHVLFRKYMEAELLHIEDSEFTAKIIKRRIY